MEKIKKIMIATPAYDGKLDVYYVDSLVKTIDISYNYNIQVMPVYMAYDALVQKARNDLFELAFNSDIDKLVFIDSDIGWKPDDFVKLVSHDLDMVGASYKRKNDFDESFVLRIDERKKENKIDRSGLMEVLGLGMGFFSISREAIKKLWNNAKKYEENGKEKRNIFSVEIINGKICSEDINLCFTWNKLKGKIYLDTTIDLIHVGVKPYAGSVIQWLKKINII